MQNWNHLLKYIKQKLGVPTNLLELSDQEIIDYIKENVLPEISVILHNDMLVRITDKHRDSSGLNEYTYYIPIPDDVTIIDIYQVYINSRNISVGQLTSSYMTLDPRDTVMQNTLVTMFQSLQMVQEYTFEQPNIIRFGIPIYGEVILHCRVVYNDISKIPIDFYHEIFKRKCLAEVMLLIVAKRKKYESLSTPFGQINLNVQELQNEAQSILSEIESKLDAMPPEYLIAWLD